MDHHKEEHVDLLPPSGSNDDTFPAVAPWSEAGHSSLSATLVEPTARRIRLGSTLGVIAYLLFGAAPCLPIHPPRTYRVRPILDKELFQCAEYVGPVALQGVNFRVTYTTREYLVFKSNSL